jgi:zinc transporter
MQLAPPIMNYGADEAGMICGYRFAEGAPGRAASAEEIAAALRRRETDSDAGEPAEFFWLHFNLAHTASVHWMRAHLGLPETFFEAMGNDSHSTRIERHEGGLLAVINDVVFDFDFGPSQVATLWAYTHRSILVTARLKPLRSIDTLRESVKHGETFRSPTELLVHLMRDQADLLTQIVRRTSAEVDRAEDRFLAAKHEADHGDLAAIRRVLVRFQRMLAPEPGAMFRLLARPPVWLDPIDVQSLRESTEEFSLVLGDMAGLIDRVKLLQEEMTAHLNEQNNRTLFTLTLVTVLALPINIVAGFFGMNVGGIPFAENKHGFWLMVLLVAGFTALAGWWTFRRRRGR